MVDMEMGVKELGRTRAYVWPVLDEVTAAGYRHVKRNRLG